MSIAVSAGSVVVAMLLMWFAAPSQIEKIEENTERPKTAVESPVLVERRDGKIIWQLRAREANQQLDGNMHLLSPILTLFTESGLEVVIMGKQAWFEPLQRNILFKDDVNVDYQGWKMVSQTLIYDSALDEIQIPEDFSIQGESISARGKNMRLQRTSDQIKVDGGIWIRDENPQLPGAKQ